MNRIKAAGLMVMWFLLCCCHFSFGQTNQGKEFWTAYMSHQEDNGPSQMSLYITGDQNTTGTVDLADGGFSLPFTVTANKVTVVNIPRDAFIKQGGQFLKGIHIIAKRKIAVYAHIYASSVSGATLLLPVNALAREYKSINYLQRSNAEQPSYSVLMVVATEDNTTVEITPTGNLLGGKPANTPFTVTLKKGEVYQGLSLLDLTNSRIRSVSTATGECKKIAVFSGSTKMGIGCQQGNFSSDNLFQQVYPTSAWGKNYITVPLKNRNYDIYRVIFSQDNTVLRINGAVVDPSLYADRPFYEFPSKINNVISADKPVQVVQYSVTQGKTIEDDCVDLNSDLGDPEMIYLNPLEQTIDHVALYSSPNAGIVFSYINVVIKTSARGTFLLDGKPVAASFEIIPSDPSYSYAQLPVSNGTHYLNAAEGFNAIAYGFGRAESYGYSAGTNLQNLNERLVFTEPQSNTVQLNGCAGIGYKLSLTIPFQTSQIRWTFSDGTAPYTDASPVVRSVEVKGAETLYTYEYYKTVQYNPGDYTVTANVLNTQNNECGSETAIDFDFNISDYPKAKFSVEGACLNANTIFKDTTDQTENIIKNWLWDFGDGETSTEQSPGHLYSVAGDYNVTLTVVNENGCSSSAMQAVKILPKPVAAFEFTGNACINIPLTLTDRSVSAIGPIKQWIWDFNDGTVETRDNNQPFTHTFAQTGNYVVKLTVVNESGCAAGFESSVTINEVPVVDFDVPDVCIADAFAQFADKTTISGNTQQFTYNWNFGDSRANTANPNTSGLKAPRHKYTQAGIYKVALTVTSGDGCPQTKTMQITVNGSVPQAKFAVLNAGNLCSAGEVIIQDQSVVDFGRITRLIIYYDYAGRPDIFEEFDRVTMAADGRYRHLYDLSATARTYKIRMQAYSGGVCESITEQDIQVKGNPQVLLTPVPPVCLNDSPVQLVASHDGFNGTGAFSGPGVGAGGMFDPKLAGTGVSTITYRFVAVNGCEVTATQSITVNPLPTVNAGGDFTMLEGDPATLAATAAGNGLTFKWTPVTGLDRDDVLNPVASPAEDIKYTLTVTNAYGCMVKDEVFVSVLKKPIVVNTFTPNNDGVNDLWNIRYLETYPGCTVDIFNRQGQKVYSSIGYAFPWDGKFKGDVLPAGPYYYIINPKNGRKAIAGNVTIIR